MTTEYSVISTTPTVYNDPLAGIVNGVLVRVHLAAYDEVHELRVPQMDPKLVKAAIDKLVKQRDAIADLGGTKST